MQKTVIIGNIGQPAQFKDSANGTFVTFTVACNERWKGNGEVQERTTWYNCAYNGKADGIAPYLVKGQQVYLEGKLTPKIYNDARGMAQIDMQFTVREIQLVGTSKANEPAPAPAATQTQPAQKQPAPAQAAMQLVEETEDLPF